MNVDQVILNSKSHIEYMLKTNKTDLRLCNFAYGCNNVVGIVSSLMFILNVMDKDITGSLINAACVVFNLILVSKNRKFKKQLEELRRVLQVQLSQINKQIKRKGIK